MRYFRDAKITTACDGCYSRRRPHETGWTSSPSFLGAPAAEVPSGRGVAARVVMQRPQLADWCPACSWGRAHGRDVPG